MEWTPLHCAAQRDSSAAIDAYLDYKIALDAVDTTGRTALHVAAMHGSLKFVKKMVSCENTQVSNSSNSTNLSVDSRGWSVLHFASWYGHSDILSFLLTRDADPMVTDKDGYAPVHVAAETGNISCIKILLEKMKVFYTDGGWSELLDEIKNVANKSTGSEKVSNFIERWNQPFEALMKGQGTVKIKLYFFFIKSLFFQHFRYMRQLMLEILTKSRNN